MTESYPIDNILEDVFIKLFINDTEVSKVTTSKKIFSYFDHFSTDLNKLFGKSITFTQHTDSTIFDFAEEINSTTLSIEMWTTHYQPITRYIDFEIVLMFEYNINN